jgi:hypothetical protein
LPCQDSRLEFGLTNVACLERVPQLLSPNALLQ